MLSFTEWMQYQEKTDIPKGGWSKKTKVPVGMKKDTSVDHMHGGKDTEKNPGKHRGKIHHHTGGHENAPGHPKHAVDPK